MCGNRAIVARRQQQQQQPTAAAEKFGRATGAAPAI
jgi:hypothetical protein